MVSLADNGVRARSEKGWCLPPRLARRALIVALLPAVLGTGGCFDVHSVGGPWVIDDFDDGDYRPADSNFGPWSCSSFQQSTTDNCSYGLDPGDGSAYSVFLDFTVDSSDDVDQQAGAQLQTGAAAPEDLSRFDEMVLSTKDSPALSSNAEMLVQLGCSSAHADDGSSPGNLFVYQALPYTSDWQTFTLPMADFTSPSWISTHVLGGPTACLERVDGIVVSVSPQVPAGESAMARFNVDDVYFQ
jgi:hypothetical protein